MVARVPDKRTRGCMKNSLKLASLLLSPSPLVATPFWRLGGSVDRWLVTGGSVSVCVTGAPHQHFGQEAAEFIIGRPVWHQFQKLFDYPTGAGRWCFSGFISFLMELKRVMTLIFN